jgi:hypothetical protein
MATSAEKLEDSQLADICRSHQAYHA